MIAIKKQSLADKAYQKLLRKILSGKIAEGERIVIDRIAKELDISLIPVREALARLYAQGMVKYVANKGYQVISAPTTSDYDQLFAARLSMEYGAMHIAFDNINDKFVAKLEDINNRIREIDSSDTSKVFSQFIKLNDAFHLALVSLTSSTPLVEAYDKLGYGPQIGRRMYHKGVPDLSINIAEHDIIIKALKERNRTTALAALDNHNYGSLARFKSNFVD
ncbi:MAG: GntR family transcriptional regulator [Oceanospirillaceae bacterium]